MKGGNYENQHESVWARFVPLAPKNRWRRGIFTKEQGYLNIINSGSGVTTNWP